MSIFGSLGMKKIQEIPHANLTRFAYSFSGVHVNGIKMLQLPTLVLKHTPIHNITLESSSKGRPLSHRGNSHSGETTLNCDHITPIT